MRDTRWGEISTLRYGRALADYGPVPARVRVFGTNGPIGYTNAAPMGAGPAVIIGRKGAYRGVHLSRGPFWVIDTAFHLELFRGIDTLWAYYSLLGSDIDGLQSGSAVPSTTREDFYQVRVRVPALAQQRAIAEALGALDDKISANTELAHSLANLSDIMFRRTRGRSISSSRLSDLVSTQYGVTTSANQGPGPRLLRVTDINKRPWIEWDTAPFCEISSAEIAKYETHAGDILVARMADPGKVGYVDEGLGSAVFASYLIRLQPHDPVQSAYIYHFMRSGEYQRYAESAMSGSVQKNMNARVIVDTDIAMPTQHELISFNETVGCLRKLMRSSLTENAALAVLRDTLLPQLMSGRLRVRDAEKQIAAVV